MLKSNLFTLVSLGIFACFMSLNTGCKSQKEFTPSSYTDQLVVFGSGGGFTGAVTEYYLLENGAIFTKAEEGYKRVAKVKKSQMSSMNDAIERVKSYEFNKPFNMYYFIEVSDGDGTNRVTWGDPKKQPSDLVQKLYKKLAGFVGASAPSGSSDIID